MLELVLAVLASLNDNICQIKKGELVTKIIYKSIF